VLDSIDGPSSLVVSQSMVAELLEGRINASATNGVCWGTRSLWVCASSDFLELKSELELLGSRCNADLTEDQADGL
jgi:hypothetical protein